jgi:competence protein ComEC
MLRRRTLTLLLSLSGLTLYVALTGATASGVRSAIMWGLVFVAAYLGRGTVALVSLSFAAAVMVAADPSLPWDIGFQLSTLGTFAIVAFTGPLARMLRRVPSPFREAVAVTVAAQLGTVPVVAAGFHSLSLAGPIANGLVLPLLPALIVLGFVLGTVSGFAALANPAGALCYALLHAIITVSQWLASEHSALTVPAFAPIVATAYYLVGGALALFLLRRVNWAPLGHWSSRAGEIGLALAVAAAGLTFSEAQAAPGDRLMYLGSGGGLLLQSAGRTALIDGSPKPLAYLEALGSRLGYRTRTIDLIVVTDARAGNVAALTAVLAHYRVGAVLDVGAEYPSAGYASWRERLRELHIPAYALRTGATVSLGGVRLTAVGPDGVCPLPQNCAGVLRLSDRSRSMLLAGAASRREQVESVFRGVSLKADELVFSAPEGIDGRFLRAVGAKKVWVMGGAAEGGVSLLGAGSEHTWDLRS